MSDVDRLKRRTPAVSVRDTAWAFGVPVDRMRAVVEASPDAARAFLEWATGACYAPEEAAARYDLPWIDPDGLDWEALLG